MSQYLFTDPQNMECHHVR